MIKAVIFDFGGVITTSPFEAFNRIEKERGLPRDFVRTVNANNPDGNAWARLERSEIEPAVFDALFAEEAARLGHELRGADVLRVLAGDIREEMVAALDRLAAVGYRLGCITNNVRGARGPGMASTQEGASRFAEVFARFDHVIESSQAGVRKPDPRIYRMMCEALDVAPAACVYLDDLGVNCKPAAAMGMHAIKVLSARQALDELGEALGIDLAG
ncbi:MAG: HAD-IA family hydrolase [Novosphingobium sp.]